MISRTSTSHSDSSVSSSKNDRAPVSRSGTEQVLRKKYKDPARLREGLDRLLGEGHYALKLRNNRYIISSPKGLDQTQLAALEEYAYQHYDSF